MTSLLGRYIRTRREALGLSPQALASAIGYHNESKGARRIQQLEEHGLEAQEFVEKVLAALELDRGRANALYLEDEARRRAAWEAWADQLIRPMLIRNEGPIFIRAMTVLTLPDSAATPVAAELYARIYARQRKCGMRLLLSRREELRINAQGEVEGRVTYSYDHPPHLPSLALRKRQPFQFRVEAPAAPEAS